MRIGLISDTHGLLRPEALEFLQGSDRILHAGDIGGPAILQALARIAPVTAVRGNNDGDAWAQPLNAVEQVRVGGVVVHLLHDCAQLGTDPRAHGVRVVVCGHSHKPRVQEHDGVLFVNPGSAGPRRFSLPVSVGELLVGHGGVRARTVVLPVAPRPRPRG